MKNYFRTYYINGSNHQVEQNSSNQELNANFFGFYAVWGKIQYLEANLILEALTDGKNTPYYHQLDFSL